MTEGGFTPITIGYRSIGRTTEEILADVTEQLNAVTADTSTRIHFVGHSLGGMVAMEVARTAPERCKRLFLIGSAGFQPVPRIARAVERPGTHAGDRSRAPGPTSRNGADDLTPRPKTDRR